MKKVIAVFAISIFTLGMAQETPKKECSAKEKKECSAKDKKACSEKDKKACDAKAADKNAKGACCSAKKKAA